MYKMSTSTDNQFNGKMPSVSYPLPAVTVSKPSDFVPSIPPTNPNPNPNPNPINTNGMNVSNDLVTVLFVTLGQQINNSAFLQSLNISSQEMMILQQIVSTQPMFIQEIINQITSILKDGKLDAHDIPALLILVKDVVNLNTIDLKLSIQNVIDVIENILVILLQSDVIPLSTDNKQLYIMLIKDSVVLLQSTINMSETINCGAFWSNLYQRIVNLFRR